MPQSVICRIGENSIKPPKKPNDYKAENCGWKGVFGMAGNGILPAGICEPCRAFPEGLPGRYGGCPGVCAEGASEGRPGTETAESPSQRAVPGRSWQGALARAVQARSQSPPSPPCRSPPRS